MLPTKHLHNRQVTDVGKKILKLHIASWLKMESLYKGRWEYVWKEDGYAYISWLICKPKLVCLELTWLTDVLLTALWFVYWIIENRKCVWKVLRNKLEKKKRGLRIKSPRKVLKSWEHWKQYPLKLYEFVLRLVPFFFQFFHSAVNCLKRSS